MAEKESIYHFSVIELFTSFTSRIVCKRREILIVSGCTMLLYGAILLYLTA